MLKPHKTALGVKSDPSQLILLTFENIPLLRGLATFDIFYTRKWITFQQMHFACKKLSMPVNTQITKCCFRTDPFLLNSMIFEILSVLRWLHMIYFLPKFTLKSTFCLTISTIIGWDCYLNLAL